MKSGCGILIFNENNQVLICKRSEENGFGQWCFVGGSIEEDEDPFCAIFREVEEETGLILESCRLLNTFYFDDKIEYIFVSSYFEEEIKLQLDEISEIKWVSLQELENYDLFKPSKLSLKIFKLYKENNVNE